MRSPSLVTLSLLSTTLLACSDDLPPPDEVREAIAGDLGHVLREAKAAADGSTRNLPTGAAFGLATGVLDPAGAAARLVAPLADRIAAKHRQSVDGEAGGTFDPDALIRTLNQELFTDANYLGDGVFRVPASLVCETTTIDPTAGTETTSIDPVCAQDLERAALRVRVAGEDDAIRFFIQIDANHDEPIGILLAHDTLAITVDLDDATAAMIALAELFGEQAPNAELSGQITGSIKIFGAAHARLGLSFDRALSIEVGEQGAALDGPGAFRFTSAAAQVASIELNGNVAKASLNLGLGETTVHAPGDAVDPETEVVLGGATVNATFQNDTLSLADLSLGNRTTTVSVAGQPAVAIDLNPDDGRKLSATLTADALAGTETLAVSPRLDLRHSIDHAALGDQPPVYDVTRVLLEGSVRGADGGQLEVLSGSLSLTTNPAQYGFSATAGQCVTGTEAFDDVTFTSYTSYSVGACL